MTRDEIEKISAVEPYCFETDREERWYEIGCIDGLKAADAEPNLESLWHDASEEPKEGEWILIQFDEDCYDTLVLCDLAADLFYARCKKYGDIRWAYISDLLPKGGEK